MGQMEPLDSCIRLQCLKQSASPTFLTFVNLHPTIDLFCSYETFILLLGPSQ